MQCLLIRQVARVLAVFPLSLKILTYENLKSSYVKNIIHERVDTFSSEYAFNVFLWQGVQKFWKNNGYPWSYYRDVTVLHNIIDFIIKLNFFKNCVSFRLLLFSTIKTHISPTSN